MRVFKHDRSIPKPKKGAPMTTTADIQVENHGTILLFRPQTDAAREWLTAHVDSEAQWFGGALVVEPRYAADLAQGLEDEGFTTRTSYRLKAEPGILPPGAA
jgi:hypothetical protein